MTTAGSSRSTRTVDAILVDTVLVYANLVEPNRSQIECDAFADVECKERRQRANVKATRVVVVGAKLSNGRELLVLFVVHVILGNLRTGHQIHSTSIAS